MKKRTQTRKIIQLNPRKITQDPNRDRHPMTQKSSKTQKSPKTQKSSDQTQKKSFVVEPRTTLTTRAKIGAHHPVPRSTLKVNAGWVSEMAQEEMGL